MTSTADLSLSAYLDAVSAKKSTPGGGAVAAVFTAEACALLEMVLNFTRQEAPSLTGMAERLTNCRGELLTLADQDIAAFEQVMQAYRGKGELEPALVAAAEVPLRMIEICRSLITETNALAEFGNSNLITDVAIAASLLVSSLEACEVNVLVNTRAMKQHRAPTEARLGDLDADKTSLRELVSQIRTNLL